MSKKSREKKLLARIKARSGKRRRKRDMTNDAPPISFMPPFDTPAFADIEPPEGFRVITATQAMLEFAAPLHDYLQADDLDDMNAILRVASTLWNFTLPKVTDNPPKEDIIEDMAETLGIDELEAANLFEQMVERKAFLFPEDIQPDDVRTMFMRKEVEYQIVQFDESQLDISEKPIPADEDDQKMGTDLEALDRSLAEGQDYDDWEGLYFQVEEACCDRYFVWLTTKGVPEQQCQEFSFCLEPFLNFVYRYTGVSVLKVSDFDIEEFFMEHLPRKIMVQPSDYVAWPPAIRLFYRFLAEKGFCTDPITLQEMISDIEPDFLDMLKRQF